MAKSADDTGFQDTVKLPTIPAGKGQVVFFRPSGLGYAIVCHPRENGQIAARVGNGKYSILNVDPGQHAFNVTGKEDGALKLNVGVGETYFIRCTIQVGFWAGHPQIFPSTRTEFQGSASRLKPEEGSPTAEADPKSSTGK